jgi:selenide,water dikinase
VLRPLHNHPATTHPDLLVGFAGADDAGVFRIDDDRAIVQTVDFFTPIVDDPYDWGRITAANALSDIYAMGAEPLTALQMIGWPRDTIPFDVVGRVIEGGSEVMAEAGCTIVGGHSIDDIEPKYGFAITGLVSPNDIMTNAGASPGQVLVLTKPIGTGILATAIKNGGVPADIQDAAIDSMVALNRGASDAARRVGVSAGTDVTGFGLLGHLAEMVRASDVSASIDVDAVPVLDGVEGYADIGAIPGGTRRNLKAVEPMVAFGPLGDRSRMILADAQTSGGLLLAIDAPLEAALHQALADTGTDGWTIGKIVERAFEHGPSGSISTS